ncbi:tRNA-specific adenosine deaminase [Aspergillus vadensis CBS 113365]|uniref:tRNA-specific adenosine deaminase n=1 Tax=Aspergillus vadensis (strain CBS 113365 / IMI 142717 / IBT 24658) TaxID=1448311 RepID=A0A319BKY1_ASPVC|nr:tRNA-specific adenosine deaminase [Aspergillus vadensis CBS 113365]PYH71640.1 tRNA-specific adenosine deaminase [Aspergillus vadensis CBS 113365]
MEQRQKQGDAGDDALAERIARVVHAHFDALPARSKPILRDDGTREWIPMCGVVVVRDNGDTADEELTCVAVTSGAKCLPTTQLASSTGLVLHDWHAEILALRAFNYWLLSEIRALIDHEHEHQQSSSSSSPTTPKPSPFIRRRQQSPNKDTNNNETPFELHPSLKIYLYCTTAPCGDASMELTMAAQDDPTPWGITPSEEEAGLLSGRANFSQLGIVRRKPARADAPSTKSKSCSDKLALRQVSSLLSRGMSLLVAVTENAYLAGVVMPREEVSETGCVRAWGVEGRMGPLVSRFQEGEGCGYGYGYYPFRVLSVDMEVVEELWAFGKPKSKEAGMKCKPGNISAVWTAAPVLGGSNSGSGGGVDRYAAENGAKQLPKLSGSWTGLYETIIGGMKQGYKASVPVGKGASALSRAKMWGALRGVLDGDGSEGGDGRQVVRAASYKEFKRAALETSVGKARERAMLEAKMVLVPWVPNDGDEEWGLEVLVDQKGKKRKRDDIKKNKDVQSS